MEITEQEARSLGENKRKLVSLRVISELCPIDGADAIEMAVVDGWKLVVKKNEFAVGDSCVYIEIDSFLPDGNEAWQFLVDKQPKMMNGKRGHKLRTIKLRGQISQGLALPLRAVPLVARGLGFDHETFHLSPEDEIKAKEFYTNWFETQAGLDDSNVDFSELLGVEKFEAPLAANLAGHAEGLFPSFIKKTDQERCQNLKNEIFGYDDIETLFDYSKLTQEVLNENVAAGRMRQKADGVYVLLHKAQASVDDEYEITLKLDGSSMTAFATKSFGRNDDDGSLKLGVCSRNLELKISEANAGNSFIRVAEDTGLLKALEKFVEENGQSIAVQGEVMGPGIQGNREGFTSLKFFVFDIYDIDVGVYLPPTQRNEIFAKLVEYGAKIDHAPVPHSRATLHELGLRSVDDLLKFAEGPSINHAVREGLVFKRLDGQFSFKAISNSFLSKEKD